MYNATVALWKLFALNRWELSKDFLDDFFGDVRHVRNALNRLRGFHKCTIKKYKDGERVGKQHSYDTLKMIPNPEPRWGQVKGKWDLTEQLLEHELKFHTPCGLLIKDYDICHHGKQCANAWKCPVAYDTPAYQRKDKRQLVRDRLLKGGLTIEWRFEIGT